MKKYIRYIHLWMGLASGLILSVLGITGSLYVFEPEIAAWLEREHYQTEREYSAFGGDMAIASFIEDTANGKIESLQWPQRGRETYMFKMFDDPNWYYFDQSSGKITSSGTGFGTLFFSFMLDLHTSLTLGETGYIVTATASLVFALCMLTTGLYLWWPHNKGRRKSSFKIRWDAKPRRLNYDLHNVTGFYLFIPLFLMGITGAYFHYDQEIQWALDKITNSEPAPHSIWEVKPAAPAADAQPLTITEALSQMAEHYPNHYKRNLWMTNDRDEGTLSFAYQQFKEVHAGADTRIFLRADQYTGEVIGEQNPEKLPTGASIAAKWLLPVHFGEFGGIATRVLWFFVGFIPAMLTFTGMKIWLGRGSKRKVWPKPANLNQINTPLRRIS